MTDRTDRRIHHLELPELAPTSGRTYVALDLETTGLDPARDAIIEVGAVRLRDGEIIGRFSTLINPQRSIPLRVTQITGIRNSDVANSPRLVDALPELLAFVDGSVSGLIGHNAPFDLGFLRNAGVNFHRPVFDTWELASILLPGLASYSLGELCLNLQIPLLDAHRAADDAEATALLFHALGEQARQLPMPVIQMILDACAGLEWPYAPFFAGAARGRADEEPLPDSPEPVAFDISAPVLEQNKAADPIPIETIDEYFAPNGPLAAQMGNHFEQRSGQIAMAAQVMTALNTGDHLLIEAGTGTGKSLAYLLPAALWATRNERRIVVATNTIALQDQLIEKDLPQVAALLQQTANRALSAAVLKGRQNYLCLRRLHAWREERQFTAPELNVLAKVLVWLTKTHTGDAGEIALLSTAEKAVWQRICSDPATCSPERCHAGGAHDEGQPGSAATLARLMSQRDFYLEARRRAESAHIIIVNHALLLADLASGGRIIPTYDHLIVDETHRLEEAATDQLTYRVEWTYVQALLRRIGLEGELMAQLHRTASRARAGELVTALAKVAAAARRTGVALVEFSERLAAFARNHGEARLEFGFPQRLALNGGMRSQPEWSQVELEWDETRNHLRECIEQVNRLVQQLDAARWWQTEPQATLLQDTRGAHTALVELAQQMDNILLAPAGARRDQIAWMEMGDATGNVTLAIAPLSVHATVEQELVRKRRSAIFTGATLRTGSSFRFIRERLGLWDVKIATVESPFDYKRSTLLYLPSDLPQPNDSRYQPLVEQAIVDAAVAAQGRTLVLFTSYQQLRATGDVIRTQLDRQGVLLLQHGQSSRSRLLREFRENEHAVLLGTRTFWEGIDLPGDQLRCLLITRLPFAVPNDPLVAARSAEFEDPFNDYTVPDAVLRLRQGFGRLIRRATDHGVVVLLDSRVWRKEYGQQFLEALPECTVRRTPLANLAGEVRKWMAKAGGDR